MSTFNDDTNKFSENTTPEIDDTFHQQLQDELKLLAQNNSQATETEWTEIMDDSNNTIKKQTAHSEAMMEMKLSGKKVSTLLKQKENRRFILLY